VPENWRPGAPWLVVAWVGVALDGETAPSPPPVVELLPGSSESTSGTIPSERGPTILASSSEIETPVDSPLAGAQILSRLTMKALAKLIRGETNMIGRRWSASCSRLDMRIKSSRAPGLSGAPTAGLSGPTAESVPWIVT
jgi:hypothetical protein